MVLVDVSEIVPYGDAQAIIRLQMEDRDTIDMAAKILNIGQGDFLRTVSVIAARKIITDNAK